MLFNDNEKEAFVLTLLTLAFNPLAIEEGLFVK
jgi:hypothetical protein